MTHTYAIVEVSQAAWDEVAAVLRDAGYDVGSDGTIDMRGLALRAKQVRDCTCDPKRPEYPLGAHYTKCPVRGRR